jgi:hypothetical protein
VSIWYDRSIGGWNMDNLGNMGSLSGLGITVRGADVSPNILGSSYGDTVSEISKNNNIGSLVKWENENEKEIVWMLTDKPYEGVVVHSDNLIQVGTTTNLKDYILRPFIGTVNIHSAAKE